MHSPARTADFFADLRLTRRTTDTIPAALRPVNIAAAYAAQDLLVRRLLERFGGQPVGYKIACTSTMAQGMLSVDAPVYGQLLSSFVHTSPTHLQASDFTLRGIEAEFAFEIAQDVPRAEVPYTADTIATYVGRACPCLEIVDHRLGGWEHFEAFSLIADNAVHGAWIAGQPCAAWRQFDLAAHQVHVVVNDEPKHHGHGENVLGHPLKALAWLANELPKQGRRLKQGEHVSTGVCTDGVYLAAVGDVVRADFGPLGQVQLTFD